jgi:hypothetical protein
LWRLFAEPGSVLRLPGGIAIQQGFRIGAVDISQQLPLSLRGQVWIATSSRSRSRPLFVALPSRSCGNSRRDDPLAAHVARAAHRRVSSGLFFFENLDVALQGFNLWHSTQYVGSSI